VFDGAAQILRHKIHCFEPVTLFGRRLRTGNGAYVKSSGVQKWGSGYQWACDRVLLVVAPLSWSLWRGSSRVTAFDINYSAGDVGRGRASKENDPRSNFFQLSIALNSKGTEHNWRGFLEWGGHISIHHANLQ
jgi:hypothetical protein